MGGGVSVIVGVAVGVRVESGVSVAVGTGVNVGSGGSSLIVGFTLGVGVTVDATSRGVGTWGVAELVLYRALIPRPMAQPMIKMITAANVILLIRVFQRLQMSRSHRFFRLFRQDKDNKQGDQRYQIKYCAETANERS